MLSRYSNASLLQHAFSMPSFIKTQIQASDGPISSYPYPTLEDSYVLKEVS